ncbi:hypothetical protein ACJJI3_19440 [Microbulbifer sp. ZKSA004]|uniref:hypothetical protein n=1 Tax=Microbulbifer sp. ZKSA004 TaxID=3243389 RepID=UPI0040397FDB
MKTSYGIITVLLLLPISAFGWEDSPCEGDVQFQKMTMIKIIEATKKYFKSTGNFPDSQYNLEAYLEPFPENLQHDFVMFEPIEHKIMLYCGSSAEASDNKTKNITCNGSLYSDQVVCTINTFIKIRTEWEPS